MALIYVLSKFEPLACNFQPVCIHLLCQAIAGDISAHKPVYEGMCVKCQELLEHGVEDAEELQQKLDNAQQRWNAIQVCVCVCMCVIRVTRLPV